MARRMIKLSLYGIYQFDNTIFENMVLPASVDREKLIDSILLESIDREVLYPSPDMLKAAIGIWSRRELPVWEHLADTLSYDYDPIYNYDRTEDYSEDYSDTGNNNLERRSAEKTIGASTSENTVNTLNTGSGDQNNLETRDLISTDSGTTSRDVEEEFTRNLRATNHSDTDVSDNHTTTGTMTGKDTGKDNGTDSQTTSNPGFNNQTGNIQTEIVSTQYGKGSTVDHTQNSSEDVSGTTNTSVDGNATESGNTNTNTAESGRHADTRTDTGTLKNAGDWNSTENRQETGNLEQSNTQDVTGQTTENGNETRQGERSHKLRAYGNIGVTTTQELIKQERELAEFNIYDYILHSFMKRFILMIY